MRFPYPPLALAVLAIGLLQGCAPAGQSSQATSTEAAPWALQTLVPAGPFHGIHGLTFDADGQLLAGSVVGAATYRIDTNTGAVSLFRGPPLGMADDLALAPDGTLAWTGYLTGEVWLQRPGEAPLRVASGLPGANSLDFTDDGDLYFSQVFLGDALYQADPSGQLPPRLLMQDMGGLNGFDFGPDGGLYGPLWFKGQIARVDVEANTLAVVAEGFDIPAAVNFDSKGQLYTIDTARGEVLRVNLQGGQHRLIAQLRPALDNLAVAADDTLYISNMADNAIIHVDPVSGRTRTLVQSPLAVAGDIALSEDGTAVYVADLFSLRRVALADGQVTELARQYAGPLENPISLGVGHGRIVVSSWATGVVQTFDATTGKSLSMVHNMPTPIDVLPLAGDAVLVLDYAGGRLLRAAGPELAEQRVLAGGLQAPVALVMDGADAVLVSESGAGRILRINLASGAREVVADGLAAPEGFAVLANGALVVAEVGSKAMVQIDPASGRNSLLHGDLPIGFPALPGTPAVYLPTGVVAAPDGSVIFSSDVNAALYRLTAP